jgi:CheY-like chemotaxis protein
MSLEGYDVVILDLDMPIMNGYEACTRIRKNLAKESIRELLGFGGNKRTTHLGGPLIDRVFMNDEEEQNAERLYIVALSGLITEAVVEKGTRCGFDGFSKIV